MTSISSSLILKPKSSPTGLFDASWNIKEFIRHANRDCTIVLSQSQWRYIFGEFVKLKTKENFTQDDFISRLGRLKKHGCTFDMSQALRLITCREEIEFDGLDNDVEYVESVYELIVLILGHVFDSEQLHRYEQKAAKCDGRSVLCLAMQARLEQLASASAPGIGIAATRTGTVTNKEKRIRRLNKLLCDSTSASSSSSSSSESDTKRASEADMSDVDHDSDLDSQDSSSSETDDSSSSGDCSDSDSDLDSDNSSNSDDGSDPSDSSDSEDDSTPASETWKDIIDTEFTQDESEVEESKMTIHMTFSNKRQKLL